MPYQYGAFLHMFTEVMEFCRNVTRTGSVFGDVGELNGARVVLEDRALYSWTLGVDSKASFGHFVL